MSDHSHDDGFCPWCAFESKGYYFSNTEQFMGYYGCFYTPNYIQEMDELAHEIKTKHGEIIVNYPAEPDDSVLEDIIQRFNMDLFLDSAIVCNEDGRLYCMWFTSHMKDATLLSVGGMAQFRQGVFPVWFGIISANDGTRTIVFNKDIPKNQYKGILHAFLGANYHGLHYRDSVKELPIRIIRHRGKKGKNGKRKPDKIYKTRRFVIANPVPLERNKPRTINRQAESWQVCGHYRHYKNGKVVYVQPHVKGPNRDKAKAHVYQI